MSRIKRWLTRKKSQGEGELKRSAVIQELVAPNSIKEGEKLTIHVSGYFSNLSWSMDSAKAEVRKREIIVEVIGKKIAGMMGAQRLKQYNTNVEVKGLEKGKYKIMAKKGTKDTLSLEVK